MIQANPVLKQPRSLTIHKSSLANRLKFVVFFMMVVLFLVERFLLNSQAMQIQVSPVVLIRHRLRYDWTNIPVQSDFAKQMVSHQNDCSIPLANFGYRNRFGLGSDLHVWTQALCNGMAKKQRVRSVSPWIFLDEEQCDMATSKRSSMLCYFPDSELHCGGDAAIAEKNKIEAWLSNPPRNFIRNECDTILEQGRFNFADLRAAAIEYLFRSLSPVVIHEAERQLNLLFPDGVPEKLITVHIRWGDKAKEMQLVPIEDYIRGVQTILDQRPYKTEKPHIYLATEDPKAFTEFKENAPQNWTLHVDQYFYDMLKYREKEDVYNQGPKTSRASKGRAGLVALGSLLLAMEADDFLLTTSSNWSRLMNELRKNVVHPRCNCTQMVDLRAGKQGLWES